MSEKNINNIGFIGSGDWGSFFFNQLCYNKNFNITHILTVKNSPIKFKNNTSENLFFYNSNFDYKNFNTANLAAIIVAGWQFKIPQWFIEEIECVILNIHGSLLPKYRGPEPIIQQILNHENEGGVTIHKVDAEWDNGDICEQIKFKINKEDDNKTLFIKAAIAGKRILENLLNKLINDKIEYSKQDSSEATYFRKINYLDYIIDESISIEGVMTLIKSFAGVYPIICKHNNTFIILKSFDISRTTIQDKDTIKINDGYIILYEFITLEQFAKHQTI